MDRVVDDGTCISNMRCNDENVLIHLHVQVQNYMFLWNCLCVSQNVEPLQGSKSLKRSIISCRWWNQSCWCWWSVYQWLKGKVTGDDDWYCGWSQGSSEGRKVWRHRTIHHVIMRVIMRVNTHVPVYQCHHRLEQNIQFILQLTPVISMWFLFQATVHHVIIG